MHSPSAAGLLLSLTLALACDTPAAPAKTEPVKPVVIPRRLIELIAGKAAQLPPQLAALSFGMSPEDADKLIPGLSQRETQLPDFPDVWVKGTFGQHGGKHVLEALRLRPRSPSPELEPLLTNAWGPPRRLVETSDPVLVWFNPEQGVRAQLQPDSLEFSTYMPFARLLGADVGKFGFETTPLLGLDRAGLQREYGPLLDDAIEATYNAQANSPSAPKPASWASILRLPPTELEWLTTTVFVDANPAGLVEQVSLRVPFAGEDGARERMLAAMKTAWGEPRSVERDFDTQLVFPGDPVTVVTESVEGLWHIRKLPTGHPDVADLPKQKQPNKR